VPPQQAPQAHAGAFGVKSTVLKFGASAANFGAAGLSARGRSARGQRADSLAATPARR
jgi:hypothetical protein